MGMHVIQRPTTRCSGESAAHRSLKRLALEWALTHGFRVAATEVALPQRRVRIDVAGYRPGKVKLERWNEGRKRRVTQWQPAVGATAIFECKASRPDYARDACSRRATAERLKILHAKRERIESELRIFYPSIRNGDSLFPEYETMDFGRPGYERYHRVMEEIRSLTTRYYRNTKFDALVEGGAANLFYVVSEPETVEAFELPAGWGSLVREGDGLREICRPHWHEVGESERLDLLQRIAMAATRAVFKEEGANPAAAWEGAIRATGRLAG